MKTQIYTMQTVEEALAVAALGVDLIGLTPSNLGLPGEITNETARAIRDAAHGKVTVVALTVETDFAPIIEMVNAVQPDILHLCPPQGAHTPEQVRELRAQLPEGIGIMQAISVADQSAVDEAIAFGEVVDYIILDTVDPNIAGIGASGKTHDWNISRAIVEGVKIPVILAGGLSPDNVAEAIRKVQPWGVDSLSHTNQPLPEGGFKKDLVKIEAFVKAAREA